MRLPGIGHDAAIFESALALCYTDRQISQMWTEQQIERAIEVLKGGGVVAFPTDTVYGLGASAFIEGAVAEVYRIKRRPRHLALPLLLSSKSELEQVASVIPELGWRLAERFLPGGLTLVLKKGPLVSSLVAPGDTVAVRIPDHPVPIALIRGLGAPLIGTSANRSGRPSPVCAEEVREQLGGEVQLVIDDGCLAGVESTVIDVSGDIPRIIRDGVVPRGEIEEACGYRL